MTAFEKAWLERSKNLPNATLIERAYAEADFRAGYLACAAEAERVCRELDASAGLATVGAKKCADAIAKLAEVEHG